MNNKSNQKTFKTDLHLLIPPEEMRSSNKVSLHQNNTKEIFLKKEYSKFNTFFNTFSSKTNTNESKSQKIFDKNLIDNKLKRINKAKSSNYKNIKSYIEEEKKKNSYLYLVKLKKYYSMQNFNNSNQMIGNFNPMLYQNNNSFNQNMNSNENLIFRLKNNLEKSGKIDHYIYGLIKGKFISIIKNHKGSKIFQKYLKYTHSDILHQIFVELSQSLEDLITDSYANYFIKKFFTYLNQKDRIDFLKGIEKSLVKLSSDSIGTYPIQTIIEHVGSKNEKIIIINALKDNIKELAIDPFGSHVLEKLLSCFEEEYINFIYNYIVDNFLDLANNNNGICVIKKILTFTHKKSLHDKIKSIIKDNRLQLISHPYANFVIQIVVECWSDYKDILLLFDKKYFNLSLEKYASNVVERCIEKDEEILNNYIDEIVDSNRIYEVMRSNYGNYVIQKAIKIAKGENKNKLIFNAAKEINKINDAKLILKWKSILSPHINELTSEQIKFLNEQNYFF